MTTRNLNLRLGHPHRHRRIRARSPVTGLGAASVKAATNYEREVHYTLAAIALTLLAWLAASLETAHILWYRWQAGDVEGSLEQAVFIAFTQVLIYGNFVYQFTRLGYLRRRLEHRPLSPEAREALYEGDAPALAILVPSYKEEPAVVRRTLLSAALQDYPRRRVVLLIDDPPEPADAESRAQLESMRRLPAEIQATLERAAEPLERACASYLARSGGPLRPDFEAATLAGLYERAALWLASMARHYPAGDHADRLFLEAVLGRAVRAHRARAGSLRASMGRGSLDRARIEREYRRLAALFRVELTCFERKRYVNLSHEPNKAMNLNSYIGLLGQSWHEARRADGVHLAPASATGASIDAPAADYLITLDADSLLVPEYALVLINEMQRPGNERLAVAQTPYNTFPNPPGLLERVAGATTDIQYLIHQGFTRFDATYWVGANALLRVAALRDIKELVRERGFEVPVFIQDRTVIEDTESSVDLVARGWKLYNYPDRLAFSATPPDFGSLLIQRRRWSNGGLIILPKLIRYLFARPHRAAKIQEGFFRVHYLGSIAAVNIGLLVLLSLPLDKSVESAWLPLTALPYFFLYGRDLRYSGYRIGDLARVYALNLLLVPVHLGGVLKSLEQAITGQRIPFSRTPKVSGRTAAPAGYVLAEYVLIAAGLVGFSFDLAAGRWVSAAFCLANVVMLGYAINCFIGVRESWEDVRLLLRPSAPVPAIPGSAPAALPSARSASELAPLLWAWPHPGQENWPARNEHLWQSEPMPQRRWARAARGIRRWRGERKAKRDRGRGTKEF
ncbi:MAG: glycosyl transferase [Betaproteobacteria bacterium]|nr:glycosyl transferase [Betaproteobacteria bacterium]